MLEQDGEPLYACPAPLGAEELNRAITGRVIPAVITGSAFPVMKAAARQGLAGMQAHNPAFSGEGPSDEQIRSLLNDPGTLTAEGRADCRERSSRALRYGQAGPRCGTWWRCHRGRRPPAPGARKWNCPNRRQNNPLGDRPALRAGNGAGRAP